MAFSNLPTRSTADANASADINVLMENIRILGGNGTSAPSTDIETLFAGAVSFTSQAGVPSSTPAALGQFNLNTTGNRLYTSTGTSSSADWDKIGVYAYGTETITGGGGDVTINLDWDWSGGTLFIFETDTSSEYLQDAGSSFMLITTYDAITAAGYTTDHIAFIQPGGNPGTVDKTTNSAGLPKSATASSFTINDDGANTKYFKWAVMA